MDIQCVPVHGDGARFRYKFKPVEHRCTRPFIYDEIILSNQIKSDGQPAVKNTEESVMKFLEKKVKELIQQAKDEYVDRSPALEKPMVSALAHNVGGALFKMSSVLRMMCDGAYHCIVDHCIVGPGKACQRFAWSLMHLPL